MLPNAFERGDSVIKAPALIMVGDQDVMQVAYAVKLAGLIPGAHVAVLPGTHGRCIGEAGNHDPNSKQPEITVLLIEEFLNGW